MKSTDCVVEILTIGREILDGRVVDTNATDIAQAILSLGLVPRYAQRVDDHRERILEAFAIAKSRSKLIFVTGGLGPTSDDMTAEVFAEFLGTPYVKNTMAYELLTQTLRRIGRTMGPAQEKQAMMGESCFVIPNRHGTAPGFGYQHPVTGQLWFFMPGVPKEMKEMLKTEVLPQLPSLKDYVSMKWATHFTAEAALQDKIKPLEARITAQGFELSYQTRFPENHIGLHGIASSAEQKEEFLKLSQDIAELTKDECFVAAEHPHPLETLESVVVKLAIQRRVLLATAESCTGGLVANRLTNVPGSSESFWGSWICYDNQAKILLGVDPGLMQKHGAVSAEVGGQLAECVWKNIAAQSKISHDLLVLSTTGIAGPTGETNEKPLGLCFVGLCFGNASSGISFRQVWRLHGPQHRSREELKLYFSQAALMRALEKLRTL